MTDTDGKQPVPKMYLLHVSYTDNNEDGITRDYWIEVIKGEMVSGGDLPPDEAAKIFFETFKDHCGEHFMRQTAEKFNDKVT